MAEAALQAAPLDERDPDLLEDEEEPKAPVIVIKKIQDGHAGAHGGAWKIALADMMTAMMAFFLLMWLLGATPEDQRQGIAEYFQPTEQKTSSKGETAGSNGMFGGRSIIDPEGIPGPPMQHALMERVTPKSEAGPDSDQGSSPNDKSKISKDAKNLSEEQKRQIAAGPCRRVARRHRRRHHHRHAGDGVHRRGCHPCRYHRRADRAQGLSGHRGRCADQDRSPVAAGQRRPLRWRLRLLPDPRDAAGVLQRAVAR